MKNNLKYLIYILITILFQSCWLRTCQENVTGKYYHNTNKKNVINFIEIKKDSTFYHYYKENNSILIDKGRWKISNPNYCEIEFSQWKSFNTDGLNYKEYGNGIMYINNNSLDSSPDGNDLDSFTK